jgi:hypothetical protein
MPPIPTAKDREQALRALAYGGKFIGEPVGFANVEIYKNGGKQLVAKGKTDQGLVPGTDGYGVTEKIVAQPYLWGQPILADQATYFTAEIDLAEPEVLLFLVTSNANPAIKTCCYRQAIPNVPLTGDSAVVVVLAGIADRGDFIGRHQTDFGDSTRHHGHRAHDVRLQDRKSFLARKELQCAGYRDGRWTDQNCRYDVYTGDPSEFTAPFPFRAPGE